MLKPGDLLGPYEIRGFLGQGGMGQVFQAFDPRLERTVALKVIVVPESDTTTRREDVLAELKGRLLREARAVASLSHPNVVGIYDVGESEGRLYLAMEYVVGATLRSLGTADDVPLPRKLQWLVDVARALEVAHGAGLVHRDVKPENVMIREDGAVKVLDFGIARRTMTGDGDRHVDTVTGGGGITGTPVYMSPEQLKGQEVDARSDQFAWGVMAYELLAGKRPWADTGDVFALVARVLTEPPPGLRAAIPDLPRPVEDTILRALSKEPAARFGSMAAAAEVLVPFATQETNPASLGPKRTDDDPRAFAATTRVPTSVVRRAHAADAAASAAEITERPRRKLAQLALPIALLAVLVSVVVVVKRTPPLAGPTTLRPLSTVPEAEDAYKDALRFWRDGASSKALGALRKAVELDSTFAAAHLELAIQTAEDDPAGAQAAFQSAFENRQMLVPRDAALLDACEAFIRPRPDLEEWETRLSSAVFQFPRDPALQLLLGRARERRADDEGARAAFEASLRLDTGFVPALAALASAEHNLGRSSEAFATLDRCARQSPVATTCFETRYRLLADQGDCHGAREQAAQWRTLDPTSAPAFRALARALVADGAPRPGVEETLERARTLDRESNGAASERWDAMLLAIVDGNFAKADDLAREFEAALPKAASRHERAGPWRVRVDILRERGDVDQAAKVARGFLDRMDAWAPHPFSMDPSLWFEEPLYRAGEITKGDFDRQRTVWTERESQRLAGGERESPAAWDMWSVYAGLSETKEEALEALRLMPQFPTPGGGRRSVALDFALGKAYALAGQPIKALPPLLRVAGTCSSLDNAFAIVRARFYLGMAYEASGNLDSARSAYERVLATWPPNTPSRTMRSASQRLVALK